jgi:hypothetical protein
MRGEKCAACRSDDSAIGHNLLSIEDEGSFVSVAVVTSSSSRGNVLAC